MAPEAGDGDMGQADPSPPAPPIRIAPSVLACDLSDLSSETQRALAAGADWVHLDVMDGHFVPNITFGAPVVSSLRPRAPGAFFDVHLMVADPGRWVADFAAAGADQFCFHAEAAGAPAVRRALLARVRDAGMRAAVALKPKTDVDECMHEDIAAGLVQMVLVMTVEPGFGGQKFMPEALRKVRELRARHPGLDIQVDGGVDEATAPLAAAAGANVLVAGSAVFKAPDLAEAIRKLREAAEGARTR